MGITLAHRGESLWELWAYVPLFEYSVGLLHVALRKLQRFT